MLHPLRPLPLPVTLPLTLGVLLIQNTRLITEALLSRHLYTNFRIASLRITPRATVLSNVSLLDASRQPLLRLDKLTLQHRPLRIVAHKATLFANISTTDFKDTNWHRHLNILSSKLPAASPPSSDSSSNPIKWGATFNSLIISISTPVLTLPNLLLPPLNLTSENVRTVQQLNTVIDGLVGTAVSKAGVSAFPRAFRTGARRMARLAAVAAVDDMMKSAGKQVKGVRKTVQSAEQFLGDLPDASGVRRWLGNTRGVLETVEQLLSPANDTQPPPNQAAPSEEQLPAHLDFRELDEE